MSKHPLFAVGAALFLSGCTASVASSVSPSITGGSRELSAAEKQVITDSLEENIREPARAKYLWNPFPPDAPANGQARYCAAVHAKSPHAAYNGLQPYMVQVRISNGQIVSATVATIAGGKDMRIVRNLCGKHGRNPDDAI